MVRFSVGRSTQKNSKKIVTDLSEVLVAPGDMIYADSAIEAANISIGQTTGHVLTVVAPGEVGWQGISGASGQVGTLEQVTVNGNTATQTVSFLNPITSLTASGNVTVAGGVTASTFLGDGTQLLGVATRLELTNNVTSIRNDITSNVLRISSIESYITGGQSGQVLTSTGSTPTWSTVTPSLVGLPSPYTSGDILYATSSTQLAKLSLGEVGQVLKSDGSQPVWATDLTGGSGGEGVGVWTATGINNTILYNSGNVGIATDAPMADLQVGSNVQISDTDTDKIKVTGNVYISKNLQVLDDVDCFQVKTTNIFIKKQVVTAQPARTSTVMIL